MPRNFLAQVWIDERPISTETISASNPATAAARAVRNAIKKKVTRMRPETWTVKLKNLKTTKTYVE